MEIEYNEVQGIIAKKRGWVPTVLHMLRRRAILDVIENEKIGSTIEFGCGSGANLYEFFRLGYYCKGIDFSGEAINLARQIFSNKIEFSLNEENKDINKYDILMAIEVLEHNKDDVQVLSEWKKYLKENGKLIVSVPAHQKLWSSSDEWAGHYRRYSREQIESVVEKAGFSVDRTLCYGYPLANRLHLIRKITNSLKLRLNKKISKKRSTQMSGTDRTLEKLIYPFYSNKLALKIIRKYTLKQRNFYNTDLGIGYLILATKLTS